MKIPGGLSGLGAVELASSYVYADFNSLQVNVTQRFAKGLTLLSNFTWGKTIDDTSSATEGNTGPPNPSTSAAPGDQPISIRNSASCFPPSTPYRTSAL